LNIKDFLGVQIPTILVETAGIEPASDRY